MDIAQLDRNDFTLNSYLMIVTLLTIVALWIIVGSVLVLYIWLSAPNRWLLDLNPINFRLPLPNVNDDLYTRNKRIIQSQKVYPQLLCPRSIAIDRDGNLYTGTLDGNVYCIWQDGSNRQQIVSHFDNGRPLGMRMSTKNVLYFVEANSGLYSYDIDIKLLHHLLDLSDCKFNDGRQSKFFADLAISENGNNTFIYIADVSRKFSIDMWSYVYLEPDSTGRILRYDVNTKKVMVVVDNLLFPNGVEITDNHQSILISELSTRRILVHHLNNRKRVDQTSVLIENLPGEPETIRRSLNKTNETYWIGMALTRDHRQEISFIDNYSKDPHLRKLILRTCYILGSILYELGKYANDYSWKCKGISLKTGLALILSDFMIYPGMAIETNLNGKILLTLKAKNDVTVMSEVCEVHSNNNERLLYVGSSGGSMSKLRITI